jgi:hypothetical protein
MKQHVSCVTRAALFQHRCCSVYVRLGTWQQLQQVLMEGRDVQCLQCGSSSVLLLLLLLLLLQLMKLMQLHNSCNQQLQQHVLNCSAHEQTPCSQRNACGQLLLTQQLLQRMDTPLTS